MATSHPRNLKITVVTGNILLVSANAIVTGEGVDFQKESHVTKALLANLPEFHEKRKALKKKHKALSLWKVYASKLNGAPFQYVLHAVLRECYNEREWLKNMLNLYQNIIKKADELKVFSVAIPLLGSGQAETAISTSVEAAVKSVIRATPQYLSNVMFVSLNNEISDMIETQIQYEETHDENNRKKSRGKGHGPRPDQGHDHHRRYYVNDWETYQIEKALALSKNESTASSRLAKSVPPGTGIEDIGPLRYSGASKALDAGHGDDEAWQEDIKLDEENSPGRDPTLTAVTCPICLNPILDPKQLDKCQHTFCRDCIDRSFREFKPVCPSCKKVYGTLTGNQPDGSTMDVSFTVSSLPGYEGHGTIAIEYRVPSGLQQANHPHPGRWYRGTRRHAYLPDNSEGKKVLRLLHTAFAQKLTFTIGRSTTTGHDDVATWNDIHHKTNIHGGPTGFGYPDPTYLARVTDELASKGVVADE